MLIGTALLGGGCSGLMPPSTATTSSGISAALPPGSATRSALRPVDQAALQALLDQTTRELLVPGAVVLLRTPEGDLTAASGTTQLGVRSSPTADTHFRIASNTKTMTAAVILQLAQEGKLTLSDPVSRYVPGVPDGEHITIAELLDMRSGLYNYTDAPEIAASADHDPTRVWTPHELLAVAFAHPAKFPPGTAFEYCNTNYALLGLVAEKVDGRPLAAAMQARLFGPLGMKETELPAATSNVLPEPYAHGYLYGSSSVALVGTPPYSAEFKAAVRSGAVQPVDFTDVNHSFAAAAGGVISTANDLATWIQALVGGRVLDAEYQRAWLDSVQPEDPSKPEGQGYGYGITRMRWDTNTIYFHGGETPGYNSFMGRDPANGVTLVVWTNLTVSLDELPTANAIMLKVLDRIYAVSPLTPVPLH